MHFDQQLFIPQFTLVKRFVYHLVYYRTLLKIYQEHRQKSEFWTLTIDAHLFRAVNNWCMVFGSNTSEPTHWKHLPTSDKDVLHNRFRDELFQATGFNQETWSHYWKCVVEFRNKYAVHRETSFDDPVPILDMALKVAYSYDNWVREVIYPIPFDEPPLELSFEALQDSIAPVLEKLFVG